MIVRRTEITLFYLQSLFINSDFTAFSLLPLIRSKQQRSNLVPRNVFPLKPFFLYLCTLSIFLVISNRGNSLEIKLYHLELRMALHRSRSLCVERSKVRSNFCIQLLWNKLREVQEFLFRKTHLKRYVTFL